MYGLPKFAERARAARHWLMALLLAGLLLPAFAHKSSDAYLFAESDGKVTTLRVDVALRDLDTALPLDSNGDGRLTWGEVKAARAVIEVFLRSGVGLQGCTLKGAGFALEQRADGVYAATTFDTDCPAGWVLQPGAIQYTLFASMDPTHRAIARVQSGQAPPQLRLIDPREPHQPMATPAAAGPTPQNAAQTTLPVAVTDAPSAQGGFITEGVGHILGGFDHVLFLLCLLLPAVMVRNPPGSARAWSPVKHPAQALWPLVGIVTMFTLAHSITLALSAFEWVSLPSSIIEPAIAVTIVLTALDNIWPLFRFPRAAVTFLFGLIHGFGFAGVLAELHLPAGQFAWALLQFNVGLELGQLALVGTAVTALYLLRERPDYPRWVITGGSTAAMLTGVWWFAERVGVLPPLAL